MRTVRLLLFVGACQLVSPALAGEILPDLVLHKGERLDGPWQTIVDPYESGFYDYRYNQRDKSEYPNRSETFYLDAKPSDPSDRVEYDFDKSPELQVPGDWNTQRAELFYYEGSVWYRRKFESPALAEGERAFVRFGAANYRADVYLNGKKLGFHLGGFTPFSFEVTQLLRSGSNSLVVRVDNKRHKSAVPTLNTDWWNYGGLTRSVSLITTPQNFIAEHRLSLDRENEKLIRGYVKLADAAADEPVSLAIEELNVQVTSKTDEEGTAHFSIPVEGLEGWSPSAPKLYSVELSCGGSKIRDRIGFRTVSTRGKELLLNDKPIFLRGICIHEEYALEGGGRVKSAEEARKLLMLAKELNCNFVRLAHYPHNEDMVRLADELGLLVWSEVPVYWTIDWGNPETYQVAEQQLEEMIRRDANRASIIIWSLANETPTSDARNEFLRKLAEKARTLDSTRLLSAAMEKHGKEGAPNVNVVQDPLADLVDIVAFNQYVGWYDGLPEKCNRVTWEIPYNKPVFVSEFGAGAKAGFHGDKNQRWTEEYQEDLYRQTLSMIDQIDGFVGCTPWILIDFRSPKRVLSGIQDGFNRKGLVSDTGVKKLAFYALQEYYGRKLAGPRISSTQSQAKVAIAEETAARP